VLRHSRTRANRLSRSRALDRVVDAVLMCLMGLCLNYVQAHERRPTKGSFLVTLAPLTLASLTQQLEKGKSIVAQFQGSSKFYPGEIAKVLTDGDSYNVDNDNGDKAKNVTRMCIKPVEPVQPLKEGQVIVAKFGLTSRLHRGKIAKVLVNGLYNLAYFDGASEKNVARKFITPVDDSSEAEESPTKKKKAVAVKQDPSPRRARIIYRKQPANPPADVWASLVSDQPLPTKVKLCFECR